jgi:hypothetical protein
VKTGRNKKCNQPNKYNEKSRAPIDQITNKKTARQRFQKLSSHEGKHKK